MSHPEKIQGRRPARRAALASLLLVALPASQAGAQSVPVSPTGIPYTVPAAARAAGWTLAAPQARTAFFGSNPAFLAGGSRYELALDAAWQQRDAGDAPQLALDEFESRLSAVTGKASLGRLALGLSWQKPFHAQFSTAGLGTTEAELQTVVGGAALELLPGLHLGASLAYLLLDRSTRDDHTYQASVGVEVGLTGATLAAALKSPLFGADASHLDEPTWLQMDARFGLGPVASFGARLGVGWWDGDAADALDVPVDVGIGATWRLIPWVQVLGGAHQIRERLGNAVLPDGSPGFGELRLGNLDQGTFLDVGVLIGQSPLHAALAIEDNHLFDTDVKSTWVTLSANAGF